MNIIEVSDYLKLTIKFLYLQDGRTKATELVAIERDITNLVFVYAVMAICCAKNCSNHAKAEIKVHMIAALLKLKAKIL